jgi:hypothetical protein
MGYNRSKSKTSRRVKRAKTNKRNNKRKQTFRKSRRVNRGGKGPQKTSDATSVVKSANQTMKEHAPQPNSLEAKAVQKQKNNNYDPDSGARTAHEKMKDMEIHEKILFNMNGKNFKDGKPRYRDAEDPTIGKIVDQNEQLENTKRQNEFEVAMDWESDDLITIGGKKKRATRRK